MWSAQSSHRRRDDFVPDSSDDTLHYMRYGAAFVICTLAAGLGFLVIHSRGVGPVKITDELSVRARIQAVGAARAYKELVTQESGRSSTEQHSFGHMFGRLLYQLEGVEGFSICDQSLLAGCFHEFIARAVMDNGFSIMPQFESQCSTAPWPTACRHGIGHGLISYLGYSTSNLGKALDECSKYSEREPEQGCFGGAFMEMNLRTMGRGGPQSFLEQGQSGVCEKVAKQYRTACFFWLPQWWRDSHFKDAPLDELFKGLGDLCMKASRNEDERKGCFEGVGYIASPSVEFDKNKSKALCNEVSAFPRDRENCWENASKSAGWKPA